MFRKTNIEERLQSFRNKRISENDILNAVKNILNKDNLKDERIAQTLNSDPIKNFNNFDFNLLESQHIYHLDHIKNICIDYRLRFLDSKYFKGPLPYEAVSKIKQLEKTHDIEINGFKIIAPSKLFKLENADDPLLFAPIGNDYYYLIHKWGKDLNPFRKWLMKPFKNFENLIFATLLVSLIATGLVPEGIFSDKMTSSQTGMIFFFMFKSIAAMVIYYGFAAGKNFNNAIWDSKYFNA
ncbi:hypothetical protein [Winogradskyella ursingii]|uniref:hypothetical protein n=1 Tax=Winogradskyella ursingii TaxID=2686079 RepID=UPI0015CA2041|nr:hypothetical protein [Winogradskyella ursingii]